jgi:hypothetical protein
MIPVPSDVRVWLAVGRTDMRRGMNGLALQVQEALGRDPHAGDLYVFRGARGDLIKISGMTGSACRCIRSGWSGVDSYGRHRPTGRSPSRRRSSPTCSTALIGGTRATPSDRGTPGRSLHFVRVSSRDL